MVFYLELAALLVLYLLVHFVKNPIRIIANSIFGILLLLVVKFTLGIAIPISLSVLGVVAVGGVGGVLLVLLFHALGLAF